MLTRNRARTQVGKEQGPVVRRRGHQAAGVGQDIEEQGDAGRVREVKAVGLPVPKAQSGIAAGKAGEKACQRVEGQGPAGVGADPREPGVGEKGAQDQVGAVVAVVELEVGKALDDAAALDEADRRRVVDAGVRVEGAPGAVEGDDQHDGEKDEPRVGLQDIPKLRKAVPVGTPEGFASKEEDHQPADHQKVAEGADPGKEAEEFTVHGQDDKAQDELWRDARCQRRGGGQMPVQDQGCPLSHPIGCQKDHRPAQENFQHIFALSPPDPDGIASGARRIVCRYVNGCRKIKS